MRELQKKWERKGREGKCGVITVAAISPVELVSVNTSLSLLPTMVSIVSDPKLWTLEATVGALVYKTSYAPMIYMAL